MHSLKELIIINESDEIFVLWYYEYFSTRNARDSCKNMR